MAPCHLTGNHGPQWSEMLTIYTYFTGRLHTRRSRMSDDPSSPCHEGKDPVSMVTNSSGQTQSLDRALRPTAASSAAAATSVRQHSLGRNQPHHHHQVPPASSTTQKGAWVNMARDSRYRKAHRQNISMNLTGLPSKLTFLSIVTIRSRQHHRLPLLQCHQRDKKCFPASPPTALLWQPKSILQWLLVIKVTVIDLEMFFSIVTESRKHVSKKEI